MTPTSELQGLRQAFQDLASALERRNFWLRRILVGVALLVLVASVAVGLGARVFFDVRETSSAVEKQSTDNGRNNLRHTIQTEEKADCGPAYLRDLLVASRTGKDITQVTLPERCVPQNLDALKAELEQVERRLAEINGK